MKNKKVIIPVGFFSIGKIGKNHRILVFNNALWNLSEFQINYLRRLSKNRDLLYFADVGFYEVQARVLKFARRKQPILICYASRNSGVVAVRVGVIKVLSILSTV